MKSTHRIALLVLIVMFPLPAGTASCAGLPSAEEMQIKVQWIRGHLLPAIATEKSPLASATPDSAALPFAFTYDGQPSRQLLGGWKYEQTVRKLDDQRTEHKLAWTDPKTQLCICLTAIDYQDLPAVEWLVEMSNRGSVNTPIIENVEPLNASEPCPQGFTVHHALGDSNSADSFAPQTDVVPAGDCTPRAYRTVGGRSSEGHMPYFSIDFGGRGVAAAIGWAGQWRAEFVQNQDKVVRTAIGQEQTHYVLYPGETVRTPRILLVFWKGEDSLRGNNLFRRVVMNHYSKQQDGHPIFPPICGTLSVKGEAADGSYEGPHVAVMPILKQRGVEVFWFDMNPQHWYGDFPKDTGTWVPLPKRFPHGFKPVGDAARQAGIDFLLWFEPERAQPGAYIFNTHPEWLTQINKNGGGLFRLGDPVARKWLTDYIDVQITAAGLKWLRWDFNMQPLPFWRHDDAPDRQGIAEIRHVEGLYAMWQDLQQRHPGLYVDICASGGRRLDFETLSYGVPLWHSDMQCAPWVPSADQLQNSALWQWVPMHGCAQPGLEPSYAFRSAMTAGNLLCAGRNGQMATDDPAEGNAVGRTIAIYHKLRPYMLGDFYPLLPHDKSETVWYAYQFHRDDTNAGMAMVFRREKCEESNCTIRLRGLDPSATYTVTFEDSPETRTLTGKDLEALQITLAKKPASAIVYYAKSSSK
jgi:alpha-galactosidase